MALRKIILDNDAKLYLDPVPEANTIGIGVGFKVGSIYEPEDKRGISHLLEHMMFKSNKKYTEEQISEGLELNGAISNGFTSTYVTFYYVESIKSGFPKIVDILYSMVENDRYNPVEFEKEKKVVLSEIERYENDPESRLFDLIPRSVYGKSDYGDPVGGFRETVEGITIEDLEEFKAKYYSPKNMFIVLTGNYSPEDINLVRSYFEKLEGDKVSLKEPSKRVGEKIVEEMDTKNQIYYAMNFRVPLDFPLIKAFSALVSGGLSSLVYRVFRIKRGIGYHVFFSKTYTYPDEMILTLGIPGFERDKEGQIYDALQELVNMASKSNLEEYWEGRKRRWRLSYEKSRINIYKRLASDAVYIPIIEKSYDEVFEESYNVSLERIQEFIENLDIDEGKEVIIYPAT